PTHSAVTANQRLAIFGLVFVEGRVIEKAVQEIANIIFPPQLGVEPGVKVGRRARRLVLAGKLGTIRRQCGNQPTQSFQTTQIVGLAKVNCAANRGVHGSAAQFLMADGLTNRRLDERRTSQVEAAPLGHEELIAQHWQVATPSDTIAHDGGELRYSLSRND